MGLVLDFGRAKFLFSNPAYRRNPGAGKGTDAHEHHQAASHLTELPIFCIAQCTTPLLHFNPPVDSAHLLHQALSANAKALVTKSSAAWAGGITTCVQISVRLDPIIDTAVTTPHRNFGLRRGCSITRVTISASLLWLLSSEERRK